MNTPGMLKKRELRRVAVTAAMAVAGAAAFVPAYHAGRKDQAQEKESSRNASSDSSTSLNDQTDLAVTVYNSNIALIRDVRDLALPKGEFRLKFMDIAATVNPATVHFRSLTDADKLSVHGAELRIRFAGAGEAAEQIRGQGSDAGAHVYGQRHDEA